MPSTVGASASWSRRIAKSLLEMGRRRLPEQMYESLYSLTYGGYRFALRAWYLRRLIGARFAGRTCTAMKRWRVFKAMPYSMVGASGLETTYDLVDSVVHMGVTGDFVECGVARGGCAGLMGLVMLDEDNGRSSRKLWLFDSFEGLPEPTSDDFDPEGSSTGDHVQPLSKGACLGTVEDVSEVLFDRFAIPRSRVQLVEGWFDQTLAPPPSDLREIAVLRIDGDWYESTKVCLAGLYDHLSDGGYVIIDDYETCFGAKKAVDEFLSLMPVGAQPVTLASDGRGGRYFQKPGIELSNMRQKARPTSVV